MLAALPRAPLVRSGVTAAAASASASTARLLPVSRSALARSSHPHSVPRRAYSISLLRPLGSTAPAHNGFRPSPARFSPAPSASRMTTTGFKITDWVDPKDKSGEFKRQVSSFRDWVGKADDKGVVAFPAEAGRYHLYVSYACPWASRALVARSLKGLQDAISFSVVHWHLGEKGWRFVEPGETNAPGVNVVPDPLPGHEGFTHLRQVYMKADPDYTGRVTVPVLFDKKTGTIVSNESAEILRMFGSAFDEVATPEGRALDIYPAALRDQIDETLAWHYETMNNGVYKAGFATTQEAYDANVQVVFEGLERAEKHMATSKGPYWFGDVLTEVDIRLFVTLIRFDPVYVQHFKCNLKDIRSGYPSLHKWMRNLYWNNPAFKDTTNFLHIKNHYTKSHTQINPFSITPFGPTPNILALDEEVAAVTAKA